MLLNILKKDFLRKKLITIVLFLFILLSALLVGSSSNLIIELLGAVDELFNQSSVPHFVQIHSGELEQLQIDEWVSNNALVEKQQTVEMLNIDRNNIYLGDSLTAEQNSVMDFDFVTQNSQFDFLLNLENQRVQVTQGNIAVPVYFIDENDIQIGDRVRIAGSAFDAEFTVTDFVRDAQMNPAIISSKRFVVSELDYSILKNNLGNGLSGEIEYLIEFQLTDQNQLDQFTQEYQASDLPQVGPVIDITLFRVLNALTDGVIALVIILVSVLLMVIVMLSLRFTVLMTLEEDYTEIGVLKAIGVQPNQIRRIYLAKYIAMATGACILGYLFSFVVTQRLMTNVALYFGIVPRNLTQYLITFAMVAVVFLFVILFCMLTLKRFNTISAVEALRTGNKVEKTTSRFKLSLQNNNLLPINAFLGIRDVAQRFRMFRLLFIVFVLCTFVVIVPLNFLNTLRSPNFVTYMGVSRSDVRIDLQLSDNMQQQFEDIINYLQNDNDVSQFLSLTTYQLKVMNNDGTQDNFAVEVGDFLTFPLEYTDGVPPVGNNEIGLSFLNARDRELNVGDEILLIRDGQEQTMTVTGIYQDVTNGGKTAKAARLPFDGVSPLRYVVLINLTSTENLQDKLSEYATAMSPAKVTDVPGYVAQTFASVIQQVQLVTILGLILAAIIAVLVTSLFLQMIIAKDFPQIAILKSLGFSLKDIQIQYIIRSLVVLTVSIIVGTVIANILGERLVGFLLSFLGAGSFTFIINPLQSYILSPLALLIIVSITTILSISSIKDFNIAQIIKE